MIYSPSILYLIDYLTLLPQLLHCKANYIPLISSIVPFLLPLRSNSTLEFLLLLTRDHQVTQVASLFPYFPIQSTSIIYKHAQSMVSTNHSHLVSAVPLESSAAARWALAFRHVKFPSRLLSSTLHKGFSHIYHTAACCYLSDFCNYWRTSPRLSWLI